VLCNDVPLVLSSELYATVSLVTGAIYYFGLQLGWQAEITIIAAMAIGFTLRVMAIVWKLEMPKFVYDRELR
jgi:uncharacterized membrane protein YeiH